MKFFRAVKRLFLFVFLLAAAGAGVAYFTLPLPGQVTILMYHFVGSQEDAEESKNFVSEEGFHKQMKYLKDLGYRPISLDEFYRIYSGETEPQGKEVVITFDDGNYTFASHAFPILKEFEYPSAVFVVSESIKGRLHGSMSQATIQELLDSGLVTIGAHSQTHPFLPELPIGRLTQEVEQSKVDLETMFKRKIHYFAYPYGELNEHAIRAVSDAGFRLAFTTSPKKLKGLEESTYSITRVKMSRTADNPIVFWVKVSGVYNWFKDLRYNGALSK